MSQPTGTIMTYSRHRLAIDGEGVTTLVLLAGCPLRCRYCLNDYCHDDRPYRVFTPEELYEELRIDNLYFQATGGGVTFGGGEPMVYSPFIEAFYQFVSKHVDGQMWRLSIETSLHVDSEHVRRLLPMVDEWIVDIKDLNPAIYEAYTERTVDKLMANLNVLAEAGAQDHVTIRLPQIPDYNKKDDIAHSEAQLRQLGFTHFDHFRYKVK